MTDNDIPHEIEALLTDPDMQAVSIVARRFDGALVATEYGNEELDREILVELAAYHLVSLEDDTGDDATELVREVVQKRNELQKRETMATGGLNRQ